MKQVTEEILMNSNYFLYIHTPFCGTCHLARSILEQIETIHNKDIFYEMNASLHPEFMYENKIESVPCLLIKQENIIKEKVYAFQSTGNIYRYLYKYKRDLFND